MLESIAAKPERLVIGIASGRSAWGVDAALVRVRGSGTSLSWTLLRHESLEYSFKVRDLILRCAEAGGTDGASIGRLDILLGELFGRAAAHVASQSGIALKDADLIGASGVTMEQHMAPVVITGIAVRGALQLAEPAVIAERTGLTTVAGFRARDRAAGGVGAPIGAYVDYLLFRHRSRGRLVLDLGAVASVTGIPAGVDRQGVVGFEIGPGTMVLDGLVGAMTGGREAFDPEGRYARRAAPDAALLQRLLEHPFLATPPPRTCGREEFGRAFLDRLLQDNASLPKEVLLATATRFTAEAIAQGCRRFLLSRNVYEEAVIAGGGSRNACLLDLLRTALPEVAMTRSDEYGVPAAARKAVAAALLANETLLGVPNNMPGATGAARPVLLGTIVPGPAGR